MLDMKIRYFADTDTLYIEFNHYIAAETLEINERTLLDLAENGDQVAITLEHARDQTDLSEFSFQQFELSNYAKGKPIP